jgi:Skp family chaperone for outer membrane proteins
MNIFLQIFLYVNVFIIGALAAIAIRHAFAHFRPHPDEKKAHPADSAPHLSPAVREQLLQKAEANFEKVLDSSAGELREELQKTAEKLNGELSKLGNQIVGAEMQRYQASLETLRKQTEAAIGSSNGDLAAHQADLKSKLTQRQADMEAKLQEDMAAEKQHLLEQIDTKLADAVASFLIETLQHDVDLGAQSSYLVKMLDEHKADFAKGVKDED